jgi:hypothetical protein
MINSIPSSMDIGTFLGSIGGGAEFMFLTNLGIEDGMYERFADDWDAFVEGMQLK